MIFCRYFPVFTFLQSGIAVYTCSGSTCLFTILYHPQFCVLINLGKERNTFPPKPWRLNHKSLQHNGEKKVGNKERNTTRIVYANLCYQRVNQKIEMIHICDYFHTSFILHVNI